MAVGSQRVQRSADVRGIVAD